MKRTLKIVGIVLVALVAVGIVGNLAEPDATTKTVEVPGPTREVEVPGETVTQEVTPQACLDAMDLSDMARQQAGKGLGVTAKFPPLVGRAFQAGLDVDVAEAEAITREMKSYNRKLDQITVDTDQVVTALDNAQAQCRAATA